MEADTLDISVVIPVYNSADCLRELLLQLTSQLDEMSGRHEIILVDDGSPDESWRVIQDLTQRYTRVVAIQLMRNSGQAFATICGLERARGEIVVTMDDDLQQRPDQLPKLLRALQAEPELDCVFGYFEEKKHAAYRNLGSRAICWLNARAFALPRGARTSSFVAMRRRLAKAVLQHRTVNPAIGVLVFRCTRKIASVPVEHGERFAGESNYTLSKQFRVAMDIICNVTMLPLRAISLIGMGSCLFSAMLVAVFLYRYFAGEIAVAGWTTVVILISFFSGSILLSLGMIGEYLVRILREVRGAPGYLIRETLTYPGITKTGGIDVRQDVSDDAVYRQLAELCEEILSDQHQADCGASAQREPMELT